MKICFFIGFYPQIIGGAEYQSRLIADEIAQKNEIFFISYGSLKDSFDIIEGYPVYQFAVNNSKIHKLTFYYFFFNKVQKILEKEQPDMVYQRVLNSFSHYLSKFCNKSNIPFVLHIADDRSITFKFSKIVDWIRYIMFKRLLKFSPKFVCQTNEQYSLLQIQNIFNAVLINNMHPVDFEHPSLQSGGRKGIIWIANIRNFKQPEIYVQMAKELHFLSGLEFHMVGLIPDNNYGFALKENINKTPNLIYHGQLTNDSINSLLAESVLLVNTSSYEGFSNVFIQAWLANIPVFSLNVNPNHILDDEKMGFCFGGDLLKMQQSIVDYYQTNGKDNRQSTYIREKAIELFSIKNNGHIISDLFDKIVNENFKKK